VHRSLGNRQHGPAVAEPVTSGRCSRDKYRDGIFGDRSKRGTVWRVLQEVPEHERQPGKMQQRGPHTHSLA